MDSAKIKLTIKILTVIALIAGLGIGILALAGPLAVWFGMADFRLGFGYLQTVNVYSDWIAGVCLVIAVGSYLIARHKGVANINGFIGMAAIGCLSAALAYFVPESFRPPEGTPPIHDITTDTINPPEYVAIAPLRADAPNSMEYGAGNNMTPERLRELQQQAYPDIVPQRFQDTPEAVFDRALAAANSLGWEIIAAEREAGRIEATDTTFWFRFKDDVVIYITEDGGETILNARSLSRVGVSDVGKNAARLREFFSLL